MADVAVIGGSEETRLLLRGLLRLYRHHIVAEGPTFRSLESSLTGLPPNVAIVDINLDSTEDSAALTAAIGKNPGLRVLLLTPHRTPQSEARAKTLGVAELVRRPFAVHELMEAIDRATPKAEATTTSPTQS